MCLICVISWVLELLSFL